MMIVGQKITPFLWFDTQKAKRVMDAMLQMKKIDIEGLRKAYEAN